MRFKAVTFNLRMNTLYDGKRYFFNRSPYILEMIKREKPDIIGFQEATTDIMRWLLANLDAYTIVGIGRNADFSGEANPVAFLKERFVLFGMNQFWLSPTPEIPGSRYKHQSKCPRVLVSVKLMEKNTKEVLRVYNTHLDHIDAQARLFGMQQILEQIASDHNCSSHPLILCGDMNASPEEESIRKVLSHKTPELIDVTAQVKHSFHGYHGGSPYEDGDKIDYIFINNLLTCRAITVWDDPCDDYYLSDHYPILADLETYTNQT